ncbi:MAG: hypothetical protein ACLVJM_02305 [Bifidobacterium adolescentis]
MASIVPPAADTFDGAAFHDILLLLPHTIVFCIIWPSNDAEKTGDEAVKGICGDVEGMESRFAIAAAAIADKTKPAPAQGECR